MRVPQLLGEVEISAVLQMAATLPHATAVPGAARQTCYLSANDLFGRMAPAIRAKLLEAVRTVDAKHWQLLAHRRVAPRCVECHRLAPGKDVLHTGHYDHGSVLTVDVMLSRPRLDFRGGRFQTLEADGRVTSHVLERGDALVFVSHKPHFVERVESGERRVLIMELWEGEERTCPHRCEARHGACIASPQKQKRYV